MRTTKEGGRVVDQRGSLRTPTQDDPEKGGSGRRGFGGDSNGPWGPSGVNVGELRRRGVRGKDLL